LGRPVFTDLLELALAARHEESWAGNESGVNYAQNALGELKRTELNRLLLKFGDTAKWEIRAGGEVISNKSGLSYGFDGKDGNKILHVLAHTVDKTKLPYPKTAPHSVFSIPNDELFDWIDDAWINRGLPDPSDLSGLAFNVNVSPKIVGTIGETGITNSR